MYLSACSPKQRRRFAACTCPHVVTKREVALRSQSVAEVPSVEGTGARFPTLSKLRKKDLSACSPKQRRRFAACTCPHGVTKLEVALRSQSVAEVPSVQPAKLASRRRRRSGHTPCGTGARFPTLSKLRKKDLSACSQGLYGQFDS